MQDLKITHLLDLMHIEGNVCKYILHHLYGEYESTADKRRKSCMACKAMNVHPEVWIYTKRVRVPDGEGGFTSKIVEVIPWAPWALRKEERIEL